MCYFCGLLILFHEAVQNSLWEHCFWIKKLLATELQLTVSLWGKCSCSIAHLNGVQKSTTPSGRTFGEKMSSHGSRLIHVMEKYKQDWHNKQQYAWGRMVTTERAGTATKDAEATRHQIQCTSLPTSFADAQKHLWQRLNFLVCTWVLILWDLAR